METEILSESLEVKYAKLEMKYEQLCKDYLSLKAKVEVKDFLNEKWESMLTLKLKVREAKETLYVMQEVLDIVEQRLKQLKGESNGSIQEARA